MRSLVAQIVAPGNFPRGTGTDFTIHGASVGGRMRVPVLWGWLELVLGMDLGLAYLKMDEIAAVGCGRAITGPQEDSTAPIKF